MSSEVQCVSINILGDDVVEGEESFMVTFSSANEHDIFIDATTVVTIEDDDGNILRKM